MFLTIQFPILDHRFYKPNSIRIKIPDWSKPKSSDIVRYFGPVMEKKAVMYGPWDSDMQYCYARGVFNLCGTGDSHFYKLLHESTTASRVVFRRFQSDGRFFAKFDIGFDDQLEEELLATGAAFNKEKFYQHIINYLLCPVKIKVGGKLMPFTPLIDSGKHLRNAYFWSTHESKPKSFSPKELNFQVEDLEPEVIIHINSNKLDLTSLAAGKVEMPGLAEEKVQLFFDSVHYMHSGRRYEVKVWIIANDDVNEKPMDFEYYKSAIRVLRKNILKIHQEKNTVKRLLEILSDAYTGIDEEGRKRIFYYLHKKLLNLAGASRNAQSQYKLVELAFKLTDTCYGAENLENQLQGVNEFINWMNKTENVPEKNVIVEYLNRNKKLISEFISGTTVFISYNHADEKIANALTKKLQEQNITVILDSQSMLAGTEIETFIFNSIKASGAIISIVSTSSLLSGWVGTETINTLTYKKFYPNTKFIPCNIDIEFFKDSFVVEGVKKIRKRIDEIDAIIDEQNKLKIDSRNFTDEKTRLHFLDANLSNIIGTLKGGLCIDITAANFEANFPKILDRIKE